jgi:two-component system invasion response regulator UvrY
MGEQGTMVVAEDERVWTGPVRILLADSQPKVRFALRVLLEQARFKIVGEAGDAGELVTQTEATCPDLVLLGWELPGLGGFGSLSALRELCPGVHVIALSGLPEAYQTALDAGADAFVSKSEPPEQLLAAIKACECQASHTDKG